MIFSKEEINLFLLYKSLGGIYLFLNNIDPFNQFNILFI